MNGIDVSKHNGAIDWGKVKASGIDFAIIRAGYGKSITQKDKTFESNYAGCKASAIAGCVPITSFTKDTITTATTLTETGLTYTTRANKAVRVTIAAMHNNSRPQEIMLSNTAGTAIYAHAEGDANTSGLTASCIIGMGGATTVVFNAKYAGATSNQVCLLAERLE